MKKQIKKEYIEILSDFGFKYFFGRPENKENLINLLNSLLEGEHVVVDLIYVNVEMDGEQQDERRVIFDLRCIGDRGEIFLVELQLQKQKFFFDRAVTYTSRIISQEVKKGLAGNTYELPPVYFIAILDFRLDDEVNLDKYYYSGKIIDEFDGEVLYDKLCYKMLVLPNFNKGKEELHTILDQWMYLIKHWHKIDKLSNYLDKRIFSRIFEVREVANLRPQERMAYLTSLDREKDYKNTMAYAEEVAEARGEARGEAKGKVEGKIELLNELGYSVEDICSKLGVTRQHVEEVLKIEKLK